MDSQDERVHNAMRQVRILLFSRDYRYLIIRFDSRKNVKQTIE